MFYDVLGFVKGLLFPMVTFSYSFLKLLLELRVIYSLKKVYMNVFSINN